MMHADYCYQKSNKLNSNFIALMMEATSTFETSVNVYQSTWRNNPEDSHLNICRSKNLVSHSDELDA
jgi:hypothetical protein